MNRYTRTLRIGTIAVVILCMAALDIHPAAAGLTASRVSGETSITSARGADMLVAQRTLENKIVAQKLRDYGVSPAEAQTRLANMSDQDLHTLATASKGLPSGADATGAIIGVLIVVILVIVVLKLMHHDVVVK